MDVKYALIPYNEICIKPVNVYVQKADRMMSTRQCMISFPLFEHIVTVLINLNYTFFLR